MFFDSYEYIENSYKTTQQQTTLRILKRGILLDVAPLYILVVGYYDKRNGTHLIEELSARPETGPSTYKDFDYKYLISFLNSFGLGSYNLFVTPQIFTEFVQHLWKVVHNTEHFRKILQESFRTRRYLEEYPVSISNCLGCKLLLDKRLEIGDISLTIVSKDSSNNIRSILTDDERFTQINEELPGIVSVYYGDIRKASIDLTSKNIPPKLLVEPSQK